jgi:protein required for attachment to host cells
VNKTTWILVANASRARIFSNIGPNKGLQLIKELTHPESREKGKDLVTDRPGSRVEAHGNSHGAYIPATRPKQNAADHFALELAKELEQARTRKSFGRLILVASLPFAGMLKGHLSEHVKALLSDTIEKDYTQTTKRELVQHLEPFVYL